MSQQHRGETPKLTWTGAGVSQVSLAESVMVELSLQEQRYCPGELGREWEEKPSSDAVESAFTGPKYEKHGCKERVQWWTEWDSDGRALGGRGGTQVLALPFCLHVHDPNLSVTPSGPEGNYQLLEARWPSSLIISQTPKTLSDTC